MVEGESTSYDWRNLHTEYFNEYLKQMANSASDVAEVRLLDRPSEALLRLQCGFLLAAESEIRVENLLEASELRDALEDLGEVRQEAADEGIPEPSNTAVDNAEQLLKGMFKISPRRFEVYPTPDAEVAIYAPGGYKRSVLVFCESGGEVLCMVNMNGQHRRSRYDGAQKLPDGFIREALVELDHAALPPR